MSSHPVNLAFRFLLEVAAYLAMGYWGWTGNDGLLRFVVALGVPILWATLWGTFAVPDDPSRSGKAPVPVLGSVRLALELAFFAFAVWTLHNAGAIQPGWILGATVIVHYLVSFDRIAWLMKQ